MCGIVGYIGKQEAYEILLDGLKRLEYRGYDSAGIATLEPTRFSGLKKTKEGCQFGAFERQHTGGHGGH